VLAHGGAVQPGEIKSLMMGFITKNLLVPPVYEWKMEPYKCFLNIDIRLKFIFLIFRFLFFPAAVCPPRAGSGPGENIFRALQQRQFG